MLLTGVIAMSIVRSETQVAQPSSPSAAAAADSEEIGGESNGATTSRKRARSEDDGGGVEPSLHSQGPLDLNSLKTYGKARFKVLKTLYLIHFWVGRIPFSNYWSSEVIQELASQYEGEEVVKIWKQKWLNRLQMVQFECHRHWKPCLI